LIDDELLVDLLQNVHTNYGVQVGLHELEHHVNVLVILGPEDIQHLNDIVVVKLLQEHYLSKCPLGVSRVLEGIENLLEGDNLLGFLVDGFSDYAVSSFAYLFDNLVTTEHL